nr:hypothetical protein [Bacteroidota bacterium]
MTTPLSIVIDTDIYNKILIPAIALRVEVEIEIDSNKYIVQDNIDAFFDFLNKSSNDLNKVSDVYYKIVINAYNDSVCYSKKFIEAEQRKITGEISLLHNQINFEVKSQIDSIWENGILKTEVFRNVRETCNFLQSTYLEFSKIGSEAQRIQNELTGTNLSAFIDNYKNNQLPILESEVKKLLVAKLETFINDGQLKSIQKEITELKSKVNELIFENTDEYIKNLKNIEDKIIEQTVELYLKVDADRQIILSEIETKKNQLKSFESKLRNFLNNKIDELENKLIESNKELIDAYQSGKQGIEDLKENVQIIKNDLNQLSAINKKEIRYTWTTNKFDDVNLGILKFLKGKQTPTELTVDIKNTIHFDITSFPPHVNKITNETKANCQIFQ